MESHSNFPPDVVWVAGNSPSLTQENHQAVPKRFKGPLVNLFHIIVWLVEVEL